LRHDGDFLSNQADAGKKTNGIRLPKGRMDLMAQQKNFRFDVDE
jgi:hypothetical protein